MTERWFPLHPDLDQLRRQSKDLLRGFTRGDPEATADFQAYHPEPVAATGAKLADAQLTLARSYGLPSWPRLVLASRMTNAIWADDIDTVRDLATQHPELLHHRTHRNWGPPMSFAANLGRDRLVTLLRGLGARDVQHAFERACLQGKIDTAKHLYAMGGRPVVGSVMGPCETQNAAGLGLLLELGAAVSDADGDRLAPVALVLETYCRNADGKHGCLELLAAHGVALPDTPPMAVHRGRMDLLEAHLRRDPDLASRTFSHQEIYPPAVGCHADESLALGGTPLAGATLLHLCVDNDEIDIARWLLERGADVNVKAAVDADGFGGHTPLFDCVVSQPYRGGVRKDDAFTRLLLEHGADPNARASLRKRLRFVADETMHEYRDVTPLAWGERFHDQDWVSRPALAAIAAAGGRPRSPGTGTGAPGQG